MAVADKYLAPLIPEQFYHIYNRTNNKERLFRENKDRLFFLQQYQKYLHPFLKTYAYCLPDNHFHFVSSVRSQAEIIAHVNEVDKKRLTQKEKQLLKHPEEDLWINYFIEWQFLRFFTSYAMNFNGFYNRKGNLFHRPFKRVEIEDDNQFSQAILYVHGNPVKHGIVSRLEDYEWSSYNRLLSDQSSFLEQEYVLEWFGGKEMFEINHKNQNLIFAQNPFSIEE